VRIASTVFVCFVVVSVGVVVVVVAAAAAAAAFREDK